MPSQMSKVSKRETIFIEAAKLFRDRGYQATSMRDLAESVDLKASSLYNHIGSKEEILNEICMLNAEKFSTGMMHIYSQSISPLDKIKKLIRLHIEIASSDYTSVTSFNDEWRHLGEPALSNFKEKRRQYEKQFLHIISLGVEDGSLQTVDPNICLHTILSSMQWLYHAKKDVDVEKNYAVISSLLIKGISR